MKHRYVGEANELGLGSKQRKGNDGRGRKTTVILQL